MEWRCLPCVGAALCGLGLFSTDVAGRFPGADGAPMTECTLTVWVFPPGRKSPGTRSDSHMLCLHALDYLYKIQFACAYDLDQVCFSPASHTDAMMLRVNAVSATWVFAVKLRR